MRTAIDFLKWLSSFRTPALDTFFGLVTRFGEEIIIFGMICFLFWCRDKDYAYRLGISFFVSAILVQGLKITFCIDRPFVIDPTLVPVSSAVGAATGYSFPSGHTQSATALYGTVFAATDKKPLRVGCAVLIVLVGVSRLWLGVHTYFDVLTAFVVTAICVFVSEKLLKGRLSEGGHGKNGLVIPLVILTFSVLLGVYAALMAKFGPTDPAQTNDCFKSAGAGMAFAVCLYVEKRFVRFDERAGSVPMQMLKLVIGAGVALMLKTLPKAIAGTSPAIDLLRYFLTVAWVIAVYPFIFDRLAGKISENKKTK